jgi:fructose PTS system EIIBC or EIIC component
MKFVGITACPTGIAHTYMAAEALTMAAKEMGHEIKVETQGSVGAENVITAANLKGVKAVIIAADTQVDQSRFAGLPIIVVGTKDAIKDAKGLITRGVNAKASEATVSTEPAKKERTGVYKHLMTGVSFMIPFVVAGGILIALGFLLGGIYVFDFDPSKNFASAIFWTGKGSFGLMIPVLAGYIAYSIADRPGIVPGFVGGALASTIGAGFLGALVAGFAAGYIVVAIKKFIKLPRTLEGLMPILIIPILGTVLIGILMYLILGQPIAAVNTAMNDFLKSMSGSNAVLLGLILGLMMAFDMGGPVNKAAYVFATATLAGATGGSMIMAAVMAAGMVPPLGIALATVIAKNKFTEPEREAGKAAWALGISFITEGAIPFAAEDPLRVIPSIMVGAGITGALSMLFNCKLSVPHGGIFVLAIPGVVANLPMYIVSLVVGIVVTALLLSVVKKTVVE